MHVKARMTAFSGLLLALSVVCMALGSVIETNTLFLLAAASYFVGIIIREFGMKAGVAFYLADILLGFLVTPNKFYVEVLKKELYKKKIKCVFKTYEAYYVDLDKCNFILKQFGKFKMNNLISEFNKEFTDLLVGNAEKRFDKNPDKYFSYAEKDDYSLCFQNLCEITIDKNTEYLGNRIREKTINDDYTLKITSSRKGK